MRKFSLFYLLAAMLLATGCESEALDQEIKKPVIKDGQTSISITGDGMVSTRSSNGRVEFTGGYATGAGLYDGTATASVEAVPYTGYQLVSFAGGKVDGDPTQYSGSSQYKFPVQQSDWQFKVTFKKKDTKFIAVGDDGSIVYYDNGNVTTQKVGTGRWYAVTYGNGKYVAVGYEHVACSTDGVNWTTSDIEADYSWTGVTYGNGKYVAVGYNKETNSSDVISSTDGVNWTTVHYVFYTLKDVTYGNGKYVAVGYNYNNFKYQGRIISSTDGVNWTTSDIEAGGLYDVAYDNGKYVAVGNERIISSADGVNWTTNIEIGGLTGFTYGNGKYVAVGNERIVCSTDGLNWTTSKLVDYSWNGVTYSNEEYVAVGYNTRVLPASSRGSIAYSTDGVNWTTSDIGTTPLNGICPIQ